MSQHKFRVGQLVDYNPGRLGMFTSAKQYKVLRLLPAEGRPKDPNTAITVFHVAL